MTLAFTSPGDCPLFYAAIRKYGPEAFVLTFLETDLTCEESSVREVHHIAEQGSKKPNGYNLTDGGEGPNGYTHSDEIRQVIRAKRALQVISAETRHKQSLAKRGKPKSEETRSKMSEAAKRRSPEHYSAVLAVNARPEVLERRLSAMRAAMAKRRALTSAQVANIGILLALGATHKELAEWFSTNTTTISYVRNGKYRSRDTK